MVVHRILKSLIPPAAPALLRKIVPSLRKPTWDGVFAHRRDVPVPPGSTYDDERRIAEMVDQARDLLMQIRAGQKPALWHETLAAIAATVMAERGGVRIVDFGGGMGTGFLQLLESLPSTREIQYEVIDLEKMRIAGRSLYADEVRIRFPDSLAQAADVPDIVYVNSVIQYIDDYAEQLRQLASLGARWLLLGRSAIGGVPTYATRQLNLPGQVLPYWFLNQSEVVQILQAAGYKLVFEGKTGICYDQSNFPVTHRIGQMCNLLFVRVFA